MLAPHPMPSGGSSPHDQLRWAASLTAVYGGPAAHATGEPILSALPALSSAVDWAAREGTADEVVLALQVADVLGAAWERLGDLHEGRSRLDAVLAAATRVGVRNDMAVARVLRRRARLAMAAQVVLEADEDLQRAYAIAAAQDDPLTLRLVLDRADLAMRRGAWDAAAEVVPELLRRTQETGDPLLQAMGLNRAGWAAFGAGDHDLARQRYERAWALADLHEDPVVEARTASGLGLLAMLRDELPEARAFWRRALELAEQVHDRSFTLHCLDGIAAMLVLSGEDEAGARLEVSVTQVRESLLHPREEAMRPLHALVLRHSATDVRPLTYAEALAFAREAVSSDR